MKLLHMNSPAEFPVSPSLSAGGEGGGSDAPLGEPALSGGGGVRVAALDPFISREMRWCVNCGGDALFVPVFACDAGRVGFCFGCGEEKIILWTRTNSEVA